MNPDVCFNTWIVNNGYGCISPRISDQSSAIHSDFLDTDNNWNNWTSWKFWFILFSMWSNDWQDERLTSQLPQSVRTLSVDRALQTQSRPVLNHFTLPSPGDSYHFVLCTTVQQKHSPHNEITCTLYRVIIAHPHVPFNILLWIKTVWFECKLSCISDVYSAWMWSAVHNFISLYPFTLIILLSL